MWNRLFPKHLSLSNVQQINKHLEVFITFHTFICENDKSELQKPASAYVEIQELSKIIDILIEEDKQPSQNRLLKPCMEFLMTKKFFDITTAAAQIDLPKGLMLYIIKLYRKILKHIKNQDFIPQIGFHSSLSSLLHVLISSIS